MIYPPPKLIAIDVDGTLQNAQGEPNTAGIEWCRRRKAEGFEIILWSMAGSDHAIDVARTFGCADIFDYILSKPGYVADDQGEAWTKSIALATAPNLPFRPFPLP